MKLDDLKQMIANSSISHMGYVILGLAALSTTGFQGAVVQMFTHGTITAASPHAAANASAWPRSRPHTACSTGRGASSGKKFATLAQAFECARPMKP